MRKYEGLISEEIENYLNMIEGMSYEELIEFDKVHPELRIKEYGGYEETNMSPEEMCKRYGFVDMTNFFVDHGVVLPDNEIIRTKMKRK